MFHLEKMNEPHLTQPMANRLKLLGISYLIRKNKPFKLLFHGPKWLSKSLKMQDL